MKPLIYPLVQVALGAIKSVFLKQTHQIWSHVVVSDRLIPNSRSYPFHLQIIHSILKITKQSDTYVPLSPYLVSILTSIISPSSKPKSSTLKPLNLETQIRVPQQYVKTRIYYQGITEEAAYLLIEWLSSSVVHSSVGFPEITVPIVVTLRRSLKSAKSNSAASSISKEQGMVRTLLERIEESAKWVEAQRKGSFSPGTMAAVSDWEQKLRSQLEHAPLIKYLKVQLKAREKRRKLLEKVRHTDG